MDEKDMEKKIEFIAITTLSALKNIFAENKLDDRKATLSLHYFIKVFIVNGWKNHNPIELLKNLMEVIKSIDKEK